MTDRKYTHHGKINTIIKLHSESKNYSSLGLNRIFFIQGLFNLSVLNEQYFRYRFKALVALLFWQ